jgi:hypothetical protein
VWQLEFDLLGNKPVVVEPSEGTLTSDAGLAPIGQFDEQIGLTAQVAAALGDPRDPGLVDPTFLEMVRMNPVLKQRSQALLEDVQRRYEETGLPQRDAMVFSYQAGSWSHPRWCLIKAETSGEGNNRRAVLTNHRYLANLFRVNLHVAAPKGGDLRRHRPNIRRIPFQQPPTPPSTYFRAPYEQSGLHGNDIAF